MSFPYLTCLQNLYSVFFLSSPTSLIILITLPWDKNPNKLHCRERYRKKLLLYYIFLMVSIRKNHSSLGLQLSPCLSMTLTHVYVFWALMKCLSLRSFCSPSSWGFMYFYLFKPFFSQNGSKKNWRRKYQKTQPLTGSLFTFTHGLFTRFPE